MCKTCTVFSRLLLSQRWWCWWAGCDCFRCGSGKWRVTACKQELAFLFGKMRSTTRRLVDRSVRHLRRPTPWFTPTDIDCGRRRKYCDCWACFVRYWSGCTCRMGFHFTPCTSWRTLRFRQLRHHWRKLHDSFCITAGKWSQGFSSKFDSSCCCRTWQKRKNVIGYESIWKFHIFVRSTFFITLTTFWEFNTFLQLNCNDLNGQG